MSVGFSARHRQQTKATVPIPATGTFVPLKSREVRPEYIRGRSPPKDGVRGHACSRTKARKSWPSAKGMMAWPKSAQIPMLQNFC